METLYTIGYEGKTTEEFKKALKKNNVSLVVDVRINPVSRKKGFSKNGLSSVLKDIGIKYIHMIDLGNPQEIRDQFNDNGDRGYLYKAYGDYLTERPELLDLLYSNIAGETSCLLCFERMPSDCHRGVISDFMHSRKGMKIIHL